MANQQNDRNRQQGGMNPDRDRQQSQQPGQGGQDRQQGGNSPGQDRQQSQQPGKGGHQQDRQDSENRDRQF
ncbi:MAG TPA: hypothetical protein VNH53_09210 [Sphingomicrobium sp.]|nr:hypothetical protein [Sphingomicrobium sp.]